MKSVSPDGIYDRAGRPITMEQWAELRREDSYKRVAETTVGDSWVSTVWLGLDHGWRSARPIIFETMVFRGPLDQEQERYSTEEEALAGHYAMVKRAADAAQAEGGDARCPVT